MMTDMVNALQSRFIRKKARDGSFNSIKTTGARHEVPIGTVRELLARTRRRLGDKFREAGAEIANTGHLDWPGSVAQGLVP